jgi:large repetitive protein
MKKRLLCLLAIFIFFASAVFAQTTLVAGDIAFTGYNTDDNTVNGPTANDDFSFILLKNITSGTVIYFTDFGWRSDAPAFQTANPCGASTGATSDGIIQWTATSDLAYGTQIRIRCRTNLSATLGSVTGIQATFNVATDYLSLASGGDQVFAYQGTFAAPTLLAGISANGPWDATLTDCQFSSAMSTLPAALSSNSYAVAITPEVDNARLKSSVMLTGNAATDITAIHDAANWDVNDVTAFLLPPVLTAAPVVTTSAGATAHTQGTPVIVDGGITVTDADNANLFSATISITGNFQSAEDVLQFTDQNGITGSYNPATGVLTLSGSSTVANYQTALRSISYNNTAVIPNTSNRTISFRTNDGAVNSNIATKTVTVTALNPAPVVTTSGGNTSFIQGTPVVVDGSITVTDANNANLVSSTVSITGGFQSSEDVLQFTNQNGITGNYNSSTGVLTLSGSATVADYQTALRSITYNNTSATPNTANRTISFVVNDGTVSSNTATKTVTITATNAAPVITSSAGITAHTQGTPVIVDGAITVTDADNANLSSATISITGNFQSAEDVLQFTNQNGITGSYNPATGVLTLSGSSTVANYQTALRSISYNNISATPNTTNRIVSFSASDGTTNSNTATKTVSVTSSTVGATTLTIGDIAFTGYNSAGTDDFSFIILRPSGITSGTQIKFTDYAWVSGACGTNGWGTTVEQEITWTASTTLTYGMQVRVNGLTASTGTVSGTALSLSQGGDQIFAFQGDRTGVYTLLAGIHMNQEAATSAANWDDVPAPTGVGSNRPACLTNGTYALFINPEVDNARLKTTVTITGDPATDRATINNAANWDVDNVNPFILPPAFNAASVVTTSAGNTSYSIGTPVAVDGALTVTDADDVNLSSATVSITGGFQSGQDILQFSNQNGITGSYNAATGILTLTGTSTVGNYQTALRSVTYNNTSATPDRSNRTISFATNDGNASSNVATKVVAFINETPVVTTSAGNTAHTPGTPVIVDGGITVTDGDNANLSSATISITGNFHSAEDVLQFTDQNGITGSYNSATGVLSLSGSSTVANYQTALRSVRYNNSSTAPNTSERTISFSVNDGIDNSNTATKTISIPPTVTINQAPGQNDPANTSPVLFRVQFSETVNGFGSNDVIVTGPAGSTATVLPASPMDVIAGTYTVSVSGMTADGTITVSIGANAVTDLAGNANTASTSTDNTVAYDATKPTVTINQATTQIDPTNTSPVNFTVVFSEPVSNFGTGDITLSGTANATTAVITGSGTTYNVAVSGMSGSGTVIATIAAGAATDAAGNENTASTSTDNTVTYDNTAPILTVVTIASNNANTAYAKLGDKVTLLFTASEAIQTPGVSILGHPVTPTLVTGNQWKAEYTTVNTDAEGTIAFLVSELKDLTGNNASDVSATTNGSSVIYDKTAPALTGVCPASQSLSAGAGCTANVSWTVPTATDANVPGTFSAYEHTGGDPGLFNTGTYNIVYKFKDPAGNETICSFTVTVTDNAGPTFTTALTANPGVIWPPNHKFEDIVLTYVTADNCSGTVTNNITVTSPDPIDGDWIVVNDHLVQLRSERSNGRDRVYTITVTPQDASGNLGTSQSVQVYVSNNPAPGARITSTEQEIREIPGKLQMMAFPNPSRNYFTLALKGSRTEQVTLRITDVWGRVVEVRKGIAANGTVRIGDNYRPGTYIAELIQGTERVRVMLIKQ